MRTDTTPARFARAQLTLLSDLTDGKMGRAGAVASESFTLWAPAQMAAASHHSGRTVSRCFHSFVWQPYLLVKPCLHASSYVGW